MCENLYANGGLWEVITQEGYNMRIIMPFRQQNSKSNFTIYYGEASDEPKIVNLCLVHNQVVAQKDFEIKQLKDRIAGLQNELTNYRLGIKTDKGENNGRY